MRNISLSGIYTQRCTTTLFASPARSIVSWSFSKTRFGNVVPIVYTLDAFSGRDLSLLISSCSSREQTTYALIKLRMSPTVCVKFIRHGILRGQPESRPYSHVGTPTSFRPPIGSAPLLLAVSDQPRTVSLHSPSPADSQPNSIPRGTTPACWSQLTPSRPGQATQAGFQIHQTDLPRVHSPRLSVSTQSPPRAVPGSRSTPTPAHDYKCVSICMRNKDASYPVLISASKRSFSGFP